VSSACGSADVLSELGVKIDVSPEIARECIDSAGIGFLFAPTFHPAMKKVMEARRSLGVPTVFNILGPLANPAGAKAQVLGVSRKDLVEIMGKALGRLGVDSAFVLHGSDGMDEFTLTGETLVFELRGESTREYVLSPEDLGLRRRSAGGLAGGDAKTNARMIRDVLSGKEGPRADISIANAAFALAAARRAESVGEGVEMAREAVRSGAAAKRLEELVAVSNGKGEVHGVP
jgi:anthranilate phosphoribosyltransferase